MTQEVRLESLRLSLAYWFRADKPKNKKGIEITKEEIDYVRKEVEQTEFVTKAGLILGGYKSYSLTGLPKLSDSVYLFIPRGFSIKARPGFILASNTQKMIEEAASYHKVRYEESQLETNL